MGCTLHFKKHLNSFNFLLSRVEFNKIEETFNPFYRLNTLSVEGRQLMLKLCREFVIGLSNGSVNVWNLVLECWELSLIKLSTVWVIFHFTLTLCNQYVCLSLHSRLASRKTDAAQFCDDSKFETRKSKDKSFHFDMTALPLQPQCIVANNFISFKSFFFVYSEWRGHDFSPAVLWEIAGTDGRLFGQPFQACSRVGWNDPRANLQYRIFYLNIVA